MSHAIPLRRFTKSNPCPICGGHDGLGRGQGVRCFGYRDRSGDYARCTREEHAGPLPQNRDGTYSHRMHGECRCGQRHGQVTDPAGDAHAAGREPPPPPGRAAVPLLFHAGGLPPQAVRRGHGRPHWIYRDADGREVFRVLRVDYRAPDGSPAKSYRPCHRAADGKWLLSRPDVPLPLYNLPAILAAPPGGDRRRPRRREMRRPRRRAGPAPCHDQRAMGARRRSSLTGRPWPADPSPSSAMPAKAARTTPPRWLRYWPPSILPPRSVSSPAGPLRRRRHRAIHRCPPLGRPHRRRGPGRALALIAAGFA